MGKIKSCFFCAIFCFSFLGLASAETVILKSGLKVEGKIIEQTNKYVKLDFQGVELTFFNEEIFSVDQTPGGTDTVSPQMELLYKAYSSSLNPAQPQVKEEGKEEVKEEVKEEAVKEVKNDSEEPGEKAAKPLPKLLRSVLNKQNSKPNPLIQ